MRMIAGLVTGQKRLVIAGLLAIAGCSGAAVVESSETAVTVRYGGLVTNIEDATALAQKACALRHKTARLRTTAYFGLGERFAHFDCV
jgi:hypothetical protein